MKPASRTLLISGASRGIGRAIAERVLADGHRLSLGVRDPACFRPRVPAPVEDLLLHRYEASDPSSARSWVEATRSRFGPIDGVIHCAGLFSRVGLLFEEGQEAEIERLWQVNVLGPWWLTREVWPDLVASGDGRVITLVSMSGKRVKGQLAAYSATKFALMALCQTMRNQGWSEGIRVTAICPSWVNTDMAAGVNALPKEAMTQPQDLAALVGQILQLPAPAVPFELALSCQLEI